MVPGPVRALSIPQCKTFPFLYTFTQPLQLFLLSIKKKKKLLTNPQLSGTFLFTSVFPAQKDYKHQLYWVQRDCKIQEWEGWGRWGDVAIEFASTRRQQGQGLRSSRTAVGSKMIRVSLGRETGCVTACVFSSIFSSILNWISCLPCILYRDNTWSLLGFHWIDLCDSL